MIYFVEGGYRIKYWLNKQFKEHAIFILLHLRGSLTEYGGEQIYT